MVVEFKINKKILVFLDETGNPSLQKIDPDFPLFAVAGVIFDPIDYPDTVFRFNKMKLNYFAHEGIILHSREIAGREGDFSFLNNDDLRHPFLSEVSQHVNLSKMKIAAGVIKKKELKEKYAKPFNPYDLAFGFVFEKAFNYACNEKADYINFIIEARGPKEDTELHEVFEYLKKKDEKGIIRAFPRYIDQGKLGKIHTRLEFRKKQSNIIGLQLADLVGSPIARTIFKGENHPSLQYFRDKFVYGIANSLKVFP